MRKITFTTPISDLWSVGRSTASKLKKLGLKTAEDLLYHFPHRYEDYSQTMPISELKAGTTATTRGTIELIQNKRSPRKRMIITEAIVADGTESIRCVWFRQPFLTRLLKTGDEVFLSGKIEISYLTLQFTNPAYEKVRKDQIHTGRLVPIYPATEKLTQKQIRFLTKLVLPLAKKVQDPLPAEIIKRQKLLSQVKALEEIHFPSSSKIAIKARERLKFDELFLLQLYALRIKKDIEQTRAVSVQFAEEETKDFAANLPFTLTAAQKKSGWTIIKDLARPHPMNRLLQGDVGSGKTVVAALAILNTALAGYQSTFLAPTEILAKQHFETLTKLFKNSKIKTALFTRSYHQTTLKDKLSKKQVLEIIRDGKIPLIVGTHALIQEDVEFKNLALVIIDEQHRFGVNQRKSLCEKSGDQETSPHLLSMTATPIPRSLALTVYGDLDLSIIDELPAGRKKILTRLVDPKNREKAYDFIRKEITQGRQIFVICPLIEESDKLGVKSVEQEYEKLTKEVFPDLKIGFLHGKLKSQEKEKTMKLFYARETDILVSTSVVEVGVDIPNASIMMIESAERFGLAQLHQFRGRVGRSKHQSYCFLFTENPSGTTHERLLALVNSNDGFALAEKDLELRGPGEMYGSIQSGFMPSLKIAQITDHTILEKAREEARNLIEKSPHLAQYPLLQEKIKGFEKRVHLE